MKLVFISDLHLSIQTPDKNEVFYSLMNKWQHELDALYILGDFFDFWCGDDDDNVFIRKIKTSFRSFTHRAPIYFIRGNHDFGLGRKFAKDTGITIIKDMSILKTPKQTILLSHGDAFCTLDIAYQRLKLILQNPIVMFILRQLPLAWRYKIKDKLEHKSGITFNAKPQETYHVVNSTIIQFAKKHGANIVIHGHTHNPGLYEIKANNCTISRFEIPDWADRAPGGYIMLDNEEFTIQLS
ncbi:MAG: UDP-2,3-diacylglucosamine hydrolase [Pseudomonadota bacterium]|nr:UDP-2,3-diacylglucosamine hydrolase [Pseudomonadota bacterium]